MCVLVVMKKERGYIGRLLGKMGSVWTRKLRAPTACGVSESSNGKTSGVIDGMP